MTSQSTAIKSACTSNCSLCTVNYDAAWSSGRERGLTNCDMQCATPNRAKGNG